MHGDVDPGFRRGLGLAVMGIAPLLAGIFFGLMAVANETTSSGTGMGVSLIGLALVAAGGILCLVGGAAIAGGRSSPPPHPPKT